MNHIEKKDPGLCCLPTIHNARKIENKSLGKDNWVARTNEKEWVCVSIRLKKIVWCDRHI